MYKSFYAYIYLITSDRGETYVGQKKGYPHQSPHYLGSGVIIKRKIAKYNKDAFHKQILAEGTFTKILLNDLERHFIQLYSSPLCSKSLNIAVGGGGGGRPGALNSMFRKDIDAEELITLYQQGWTIKQLMSKYKCERSTIVNRIPKNIIRPKYKKIDEEILLDLYLNKQYSVKQLMKYFQMDRLTIESRLLKRNITLRTHKASLLITNAKKRKAQFIYNLTDEEFITLYKHYPKQQLLTHLQVTEDQYQSFRRKRVDLFVKLPSRPGPIKKIQ